MLETVDFSEKTLPKDEYKARRDALTERLVVLQQQACVAGVGLVVLFEGWNGAGKGSRISDLLYNLDARATITFYDRGWYTSAVQRMLYTQFGEVKIKNGKVLHPRATVARAVREAAEERHIDALRGALASSADFEKQLTDDDYVVVKFFVHVTKEAQRKRLTNLRRDPATAWRVSDGKMATIGEYEEAYRLYDNLLEGSDFSYAPWHLINGEDKRRANLKITETLVDALEKALHAKKDPAALAAAAKAQANSSGAAVEEIPLEGRSPEQQRAVAEHAAAQAAAQAAHAPRASRFRIVDRVPSLDEVDHGLVLDQHEYKDRLKKQQKRLNKLEMEMYQARVPLILMFEGWDAAGKGGAIKRVAQALDARAYTIFPSPAPTKPELAHPHLWRYWTRLPKAGHVGIYDRSWYGRVLVERVEGFATDAQWARAYDEINEFEQELVRWGAVLLKFWVDVSQEEQLARFRARQEDPAKQWKITDEDWRNRDKYPQYKSAVEDMFRLTSTPFAPWIVLESDDKRFARVKALETINDALEVRLHGE